MTNIRVDLNALYDCKKYKMFEAGEQKTFVMKKGWGDYVFIEKSDQPVYIYKTDIDDLFIIGVDSLDEN
jgi:hypothetical protein